MVLNKVSQHNSSGKGGKEKQKMQIGKQHSDPKIFPSSRFRWFDQDYNGAKEHVFATKVDGSPENDESTIRSKFEELKQLKCSRQQIGHNEKERDGTKLSNQGEIVSNDKILPIQDNAVLEEDDNDGLVVCEWDFKCKDFVDIDTKEDHKRKGILYYMLKINIHANFLHRHGPKNITNQAKKLWQVLLDRQSTCDVIINSDFYNIISCKFTLNLQIQLGECRMHKIVNLDGARTALYYAEGTVNIMYP